MANDTDVTPTGNGHEPNLDGRWSGRRCPRCQAQTLTNDVNDEWCSYVECDWSNEEAAGA